jgi:hypothetical protein
MENVNLTIPDAAQAIKELYEMPAYLYQGKIIFPLYNGGVVQIDISTRDDLAGLKFHERDGIHYDEMENDEQMLQPIPIML